jgi:hypothetical protein
VSPPHLPFFDMEIAFDRDSGRWSGSWSLCKRSGGVILERPSKSTSSMPSVFVGDWEGQIDPAFPFVGGGTLHIRQSMDGTLIGWMDRTRFSTRNVSHVLLESTADKAIVITFSGGSYKAVLSSDGRSLGGQWYQENSLGPPFTSTSPTRYSRRD